MAKVAISGVFRLSSRKEFVFASSILAGRIEPGMIVRVPLQGELYSCVPIIGVEFVHHSNRSTEVGLRCTENSEQDADVYSDLCPPGTVVEVMHVEDGDVLSRL